MTSYMQEKVEVSADLKHETEMAYLIDDGSQEVWVPKSQVEHYEHDGTFVMPRWLASKNDLDFEEMEQDDDPR